MRIIETIADIRSLVFEARAEGVRVGFVPTMGNLHAGHMSLVAASKSRTNFTVVSVFVNPFQFSQGEDFGTYPRTKEADVDQLARAGVDVLFLPEAKTIYPGGTESITRVEVPGLGHELCGAFRPHFFRGVCTVVNLLLNIVAADVAFFGEKDYQQLIIVKRMVRDLHIPTEIVGLATIREKDGLAMSSRNAYLGEHQRACAPALYHTLGTLASGLVAGERDYGTAEKVAIQSLKESSFEPDYVSVRNAFDLSSPAPSNRELIVLGAAWLGSTRLIDNVRVRLPGMLQESLK